MKSKRVGLFGGTFDPIHHGHLIMARDVMEQDQLDEVVFIPCANSPHKPERTKASDEDRLALIRIAVADEPGFTVSDIEIQRGGISYTIDTVLYYKSLFPKDTFFWLAGEDQAEKLDTWHRIDELRTLISFRFMHREGSQEHLTLGRRLDISSTEIRQRIASGLSIRYLVPEPVRKEIERRQLYRTPLTPK